MKGIVDFMQNVDALAFVVLGGAGGIGWARRRERSLGFLALAIVLLSAVSLLGRLPSLSLGFAGIVAILLIAVGAGTAASNQAVQFAIQLIVLAIVPLLYVSFAPPAWLRREWRASEEEGLRVFMQDLLLLHESRASLANRALEWAMRL